MHFVDDGVWEKVGSNFEVASSSGLDCMGWRRNLRSLISASFSGEFWEGLREPPLPSYRGSNLNTRPLENSTETPHCLSDFSKTQLQRNCSRYVMQRIDGHTFLIYSQLRPCLSHLGPRKVCLRLGAWAHF